MQKLDLFDGRPCETSLRQELTKNTTGSQIYFTKDTLLLLRFVFFFLFNSYYIMSVSSELPLDPPKQVKKGEN